MIPHTNPDGTLTPWGAQRQLGLLIKDPVGNVGKVILVNHFGDCMIVYKSRNVDTYPCRSLRPHPVPLTPETAYVGQFVREIARPYLIGRIERLHGPWNKEDGDDTFYAKIVGAGFNEFEADISEYEALPRHCQGQHANNPNVELY